MQALAFPLSPFSTGYFRAFLYALTLVSQWTTRWIQNPSDLFWNVQPRSTPPACLTDPILGNHAFVQLGDIKLHYVEKGDRTKPLLLFVHGFPEFWYSWRHQIKEFSADYWVVAIDKRGYGDSDKPEGIENYKIELIIADIKDLVTTLGREKFTMVGHDLGGAITWTFALMHPEMVESFVIMNAPHPTVLRNYLHSSPAQVNKSWYMFFYQVPFVPELRFLVDDMNALELTLKSNKVPPTFTKDDLEAWKYTFGKTGAFTPPINYYRANVLLDFSEGLKSLGKAKDFPPCLALFGDEDQILDLLQEDGVGMVSNARLVYIHNASHFVQQDAPDAVNKEMKKFFAEIKSISR